MLLSVWTSAGKRSPKWIPQTFSMSIDAVSPSVPWRLPLDLELVDQAAAALALAARRDE